MAKELRLAVTLEIPDDIWEQASAGFYAKVLRQLIRLRKQEPAKVEEQEQLLAVYRSALA